MTAGSVAMKHFDSPKRSIVSTVLGVWREARSKKQSPWLECRRAVTGAGSLFRIHMRSEPPRDYRSGFPTAEEKEALKLFIDGLYDEGIVMIHTGAGALSTAMTEVEIDRMAEAVLTSLRRVKTPPQD